MAELASVINIASSHETRGRIRHSNPCWSILVGRSVFCRAPVRGVSLSNLRVIFTQNAGWQILWLLLSWAHLWAVKSSGAYGMHDST